MALTLLGCASLLLFPTAFAVAQAPTPPPPANPRAAAPEDITGYWVSVITEDWRYRMTTPPVGEVAGIPLNQQAMKVAMQFQPAKDIADGEQCRAFGAAGIMRMPVRLHITWQDEATLKVDIDNGQQVRLFHFDKSTAAPAKPDWQGISVADWETLPQALGQAPVAFGVPGQAQGANRARVMAPPVIPLSGSLKVVTTHMRPGYLRRNGVPYSGDALLTEYFDRMAGPNGDEWLILTSTLEDPQYLAIPYMLTSQFKKESDGTKFKPRPCEVTQPTKGPSVPQ